MINPGESQIFFTTVHTLLVAGSRPRLAQSFLCGFIHRTTQVNERSERSALVCETTQKLLS